MTTLVLTVVGGPLLVMWLMRPEAIIRRGRNALVGIRIPSTMASDEAWAEGHRAAWPVTRNSSVAGLVVLVPLVAVGLLLNRPGGPLAGWEVVDVMAAAALVSMTVWTVGVLVGARKASRAAHEVAARNGTRPW